MATNQEKVKAFLDRFGSAGKKVLAQAEEVEKEAQALGVAFKEADTTLDDELEEKTLKARKAVKKPQKQLDLFVEDDEENEEAEEELEEEMGEDVELKKKDTDILDPELEESFETDEGDSFEDLDIESDEELSFDDDEDYDSEKDYEFVMGNMTLKEYGDMMAEVFVEALSPMAEELSEIRKLLGRRKEADNLMLESQLEHGQAIESLQKQFDSIESTLKSTRGTLKALMSEQPKTVVKNYVASEADETVIPDNHRLKQAAPAPDPLADFTKFVVGGNL